MNEPTLFDPPTIDESASKVATDDAIERVGQGAGEAWKVRALAAIHSVCRENDEFIVDAVWETGLDRPANGRALGHVMRTARVKGWFEATGKHRPSAQVQCHRNPRAVWRSLLRDAR